MSKPDDGARRFIIGPCGDPYSRAWDAVEYQRFGERTGTFRGDLSGLHRKGGLVRVLRKMYPGCRIRKAR